MSDEKGYEREFHYWESQGKDLINGSEDEKEKRYKNGRGDNGWAVYFLFVFVWNLYLYIESMFGAKKKKSELNHQKKQSQRRRFVCLCLFFF